jgi:hypothetical protein
VLLLMLYVAIVVHNRVRPIDRLLTPRIIGIGAVLFFFMLAMPLFRSAGAFERLGSNPELLVQESMRNLSYLSRDLSGADRGMVVVTYFSNPNRLWWGASYRDLLYAPIPRKFMPDKPPVDDGVYLRGIADGNHPRPSMPAHELPLTSWPPGTWIMYMNFGLPAYLLGSLMLGFVIGAAYQYMLLSRATPFGIFIYGFILLGGFSWSNYGIAVFLTSMAITIPVFWALFASKARWLARRSPAALAEPSHP